MEILLFGLMIFIICITASYVTALLINRFSKNEYRFNFKFAVTNALFFLIYSHSIVLGGLDVMS